ncbi:TPA: hypothetical protein ACQSSI_002892 [Pseudomonas aeruginosa]|uniref:hypothetical protein n=1 Tax=Pseudomonas aeruginosa TaxID=287 RepID=UPI001BC9FC6F|nr:hypothetical protein [Pseudomonas aeruginosa]MCV4046291.1 hypothetical protein [Pseudomonas aeruginosa]
MSTLKLRDLINDARADAGWPRIRNDQFLARVEDELGDELEGVQKYYTPFHGNQVTAYDVTLDQCVLVGMRESKSVRRTVFAVLEAVQSKVGKDKAEKAEAHC